MPRREEIVLTGKMYSERDNPRYYRTLFIPDHKNEKRKGNVENEDNNIEVESATETETNVEIEEPETEAEVETEAESKTESKESVEIEADITAEIQVDAQAEPAIGFELEIESGNEVKEYGKKFSFSSLKDKIKEKFSKKETLISESSEKILEDETSEGSEKVKLTDMFSKSTIVVMAVAVVLVAAVGFFFGWIMPIIWK